MTAPARINAGAKPSPPTRRRQGCMARLLAGPKMAWTLLVGVAFCQHPALALLVVGWTYRLMQRCVVRQWWKASERRADMTVEDLFLAVPGMRQDGNAPNWFLRQSFGAGLRDIWTSATPLARKLRLTLGALVGSLGQNAKLGLQAMANTWVLTLPGCTLWLFAWFAGWNNSFHKGYEFAWVGPTTGLLGVGLFIIAMLYAPMAQARQAATGSWRSFYDVSLVGRLIRQRWRASVLLAALYTLLALPVMTLLTLPMFFEQIWPELSALSDAEALDFLKRYYFRAGAVGFVAFVGLKLAAARLYAAGVARALRSGAIGLDELAVNERRTLATLGLTSVDAEPLPPRRKRYGLVARWRKGMALCAVLALWLLFVAQIFVAAFLNYYPITSWINHPLVHLPWFSAILHP